MELEIAVLSRSGSREHNEDACGYWSSEDVCCCVVCDGAGGHGGGDVAARTVVTSIVGDFAAHPQVSLEALEALVCNANQAVVSGQDKGSELECMRTTVAVVMIDCLRAVLLWGHVGDTRVYGFRDGGVMFQSRDHSVLQRMIDAGYGDADLLRSHPRRGVLLHALGSTEPLPQAALAPPLYLRDGDAFLLCSDGLWEAVSEAAMLRGLHSSADAVGWLAALEHEVLGSAQPYHDNYSAVAIRVDHVGDATRIDVS